MDPGFCVLSKYAIETNVIFKKHFIGFEYHLVTDDESNNMKSLLMF